MARKSASPIDEIVSLLPPKRALSWDHQIADEHRETLVEIKAAYVAGKFGTKKATAARAIAQWINAQGISNVGRQGVLQWLEKA